MRRLMIALFLTVLAVPAHAQKDRDAAVFEVSYFAGGGKFETVQLWCEQLTTEQDLAPDEGSLDKQSERQLKMARARMKQLGGQLGREVRVKYYITSLYGRMETDLGKRGKIITVIRMDVDEPFFAVWTTKKKKAQKIALKTLERNRVNKGITTSYDGLSGKKLEIMGHRTIEYKGLGGKCFVGEGHKKALPVVQEFCEKAREIFGGYKGEILWNIVDGTQHFPIVGTVKQERGGLLFDGTSSRGTSYAVAMRTIEFRKSGDDDIAMPPMDVPDGYEVKEVGFPKKPKN